MPAGERSGAHSAPDGRRSFVLPRTAMRLNP